MFSGGVNHHAEYRQIINQLRLEIYETSDAAFRDHTRNCYPFNRIFAVAAAGQERSTLFSHSCGTHLAMEPGCIYFMSGGTDLEFEFLPDTHFFAFHFNIRLGARDLFTGHDFLRVVSHREALIGEIQNLLEERTPSPGQFCRLQSIVMQCIADFLPGIPHHAADTAFWDPLLYWIERHGDAATTMDELAEIVGISTDTFSRKFSKEFKITPKRYLELEVARKAGRKLVTTTASLQEIARELRFSDPYYFCRFFRKMTGIPPGQFRKQTERI